MRYKVRFDLMCDGTKVYKNLLYNALRRYCSAPLTRVGIRHET